MTGIWPLIKLILRRDRVKLPLWIFCVTAFLLMMIPLLQNTYGTPDSLQTLFATFKVNPAGLLLTGMMDAPTFGGLFTIETVLWWGLAIAFMNTLFVVRHTRANEELGAEELILSGRVSRNAGSFATLIVAIFANLLMGILIFLGMIIMSDGGELWSNSQALLYAAGFATLGLVWTAVALVVAQLVESSRSANGILAGLIGLSFLLRGVGDFLGNVGANGLVQPQWLANLSPFGWLQATRSLTFANSQPLIIPVIFMIFAIILAFILLNFRDEGAGILPSRNGRARASRILLNPFGLTWNLQRNAFFGWLIGALAMAVICGALVPQMSHVYDSSPQLMNIIAAMGGRGALVPTFLSAMLMIMVLMILAYVVQAAGKLRSEETAGHLENLFATRLSRNAWLARHLLTILLAALIMLIATGLTLALAVNFATSDHVRVGDYVLAALSYSPVVALFAGGCVVFFGLLPRLATAIMWIYFGFVAFVSWVGGLLNLPAWLANFSPLNYTAAAPAEAVVAKPLVVMSVVAICLIALGFVWWRRRDVE